MSLTEEQRKAYAQQLNTNPLLKEFLDKQEDVLAVWDGTDASDTAKREDIWRDRQAVRRFRSRLETELTRLMKQE